MNMDRKADASTHPRTKTLVKECHLLRSRFMTAWWWNRSRCTTTVNKSKVENDDGVEIESKSMYDNGGIEVDVRQR